MRTISQLIRGLRGGVTALVFSRRIIQAWSKNYLTRKLNESPNLEASLGDVELHWFPTLDLSVVQNALLS